MERNKILERERQQQQQPEDKRDRQEDQCNAELAVTKHFEESLRRAKEKVITEHIYLFTTKMSNARICHLL